MRYLPSLDVLARLGLRSVGDLVHYNRMRGMILQGADHHAINKVDRRGMGKSRTSMKAKGFWGNKKQ